MPPGDKPRPVSSTIGAFVAGVFAVTLAAAAAQAQHAGPRASRADAGAPLDGETPAAVDPAREADAAAAGDGDAGADAESFEALRQRAATEFALGMVAYRRGEFAAAAAHFDAAYGALPDPAPLFNMARALEAAGEVQRAIETYERYLAEAPDARGRAEVVDRVAVLRARPVQVFVSTEPPGALVFVDEDPNPLPNVTPTVLRMAPGPHVVVAEHDGYRRTVRRFVARAGEPETLSITLPADGGEPVAAGTGVAAQQRVLNRRTESLVSFRLAVLIGLSRTYDNEGFRATIGGEAWLFLGRSLTSKLHFERVEPDGLWTIATGDFGYVFPLEDLDLGLWAVAGVGYGPLDRARPDERRVVPVLGAEARLDWLFHPRISLGVYFRLAWRNFFVAQVEPLNSLGLSVSLSF